MGIFKAPSVPGAGFFGGVGQRVNTRWNYVTACESPAFSIATLATASRHETDGKEAKALPVVRWANQIDLKLNFPQIRNMFNGTIEGRTLSPIAAEIIGTKLAKSAGVGSAEVRVVDDPEAFNPTDGWVLKGLCAGRMVAMFDRMPDDLKGLWKEMVKMQGNSFLAVKKIPNAITGEYFKKLYGVSSGNPVRMLWMQKGDSDPQADIAWAQGFYSDFSPTEEARAAIVWDSAQSLAAHAFRAFMMCTALHPGNVMVDMRGTAYSIDHELCYEWQPDDLDMLFEHVRPATRAFAALRGVAEMRPADIETAFAAVDFDTEWPLGSKEETVRLYLKRLDEWRSSFRAAQSRHP